MQPLNTIKNQLENIYCAILKRIHILHVAVGAAILFSTLVTVYLIQLYIPNTHNLSFSDATCFRKTVLLPQLHKLGGGEFLSAQFADTVNIAGQPVAARSVCAQIRDLPKENTLQAITVQPLGLGFIGSNTKFTVPSFPSLQTKEAKVVPPIVAVKETLRFSLDKPDRTFTYKLFIDQQQTGCEAQDKAIACDLSKLSLVQAQTYSLKLEQQFQDKKIATLTSSTITTVTPTKVTASSIANGSTIYDAPGSISITLDKPIASYAGISALDSKGTPLKTTVSSKETVLTIGFAVPLPRGETITVAINEIKATDKGFLQEPYSMTFKTSTGPKVVGSSIGSYNVNPNSSIRLTFDTAPKSENLSQFIQLHGNGGIVQTKLSISGNSVTLSPVRNFERCESFSIKILEGLQNTYGIGGQTSWQQQSRSTCRQTFSIGTSVEGRGITAYKFGNGSSVVLYIGATHGSEPSSKYTLDSWVEYLESRAPEIPAHRSIVVIPSINPDGIAKGSRTNARGVDLNRNFPANNWKADVTMPGGQLVPNGGGTSPLSEPESSALAAYTLAIKPRLVLTYHAKGSIVTANESGDSMSLAISYGRQVGYRAVAESQLGSTFNYDTTGAYENWLHDKVGIPTLLIELPGNTSSYYSTNRAAMWTMVTL